MRCGRDWKRAAIVGPERVTVKQFLANRRRRLDGSDTPNNDQRRSGAAERIGSIPFTAPDAFFLTIPRQSDESPSPSDHGFRPNCQRRLYERPAAPAELLHLETRPLKIIVYV
jgi:hypothetical protein